MLSILILIPIGMLILNIWIWLFENIFFLNSQKDKIFLIVVLSGIISGGSILIYPIILKIFGRSELIFTDVSNLNNIFIVLFFILYLFIVIIFTRILTLNIKLTYFFLINLIVFIGIFTFFGYIGVIFFSSSYIFYYILVALGEEFIKFFCGENFYEKFKISNNDILIFSILSALGFAFIENFVYLVGGISGKEFFSGLVGGGFILLTRGVIGFLIHIIFTGQIGMLLSHGLKIRMIIFYSILGIIIGVSMHILYNICIFYGLTFVIIIALILGYFFISYLFYRTDRIYLS